MLGQLGTRRLPVLLYHQITAGVRSAARDPLRLAVSRRRFASHMRFLHSRGYRAVSLDDLDRDNATEKGGSGRRRVLLTFDDGYRDFADNALPVLAELGFTATVFVVTDRLGGTGDWSPGDALLGAQEISTLARSGISFGSHTSSHPRLTQLDDGEVRRELLGSRRRLSDLLDREVTAVAYPYGLCDARVRRIAAEVGYRLGFGLTPPVFRSAWDRFRRKSEALFEIPRLELHAEDSLVALRLRLSLLNPLLTGVRKTLLGARRRF